MQQSLAQAPETLVRSYMDWWNLAGVETLCADAPTDWMHQPVTAEAPAHSPATLKSPAAVPTTASPPPTAPAAAWPTDLAALQAELAESSQLPGSSYSTRRASPVGGIGARLMLIGDIPEAEEIEAGQFGAGAVGRLTDAMMCAIGLLRADFYQTALAHSLPATGALPPEDFAYLAQFGRHHASLALPTRILLLGDAACQAFLGLNLMDARGHLHDFNHNGRKWTAFVTFHPRTLLARPALKAQAWQDLQMLANKD